ncbi:glycosyl transferase [Lineolata rhizophorae]|uniref:Alpha-1,3-glucosyltransferase n=1 Tax=Lineolata rhizophorae TaxID=578093 RepID=A0A6A6P8A3_9PEZI|nr:glycosyl transferase [Lineolata rhizophorae]
MAPPSSHKPRRRRKHDDQPHFPLVSFLRPAKGESQWIVLPLILMAAGLFRWATAMWDYSGFQSPPMHGDFEAQRHWMEITTHLPITQWYFHDLEWWGLDYPPLTAYHSWLLGKVGAIINPSWFALYTSRGLDDPDLKVFMRATAFISEYLIYVPAVVIFLRRYSLQQGVNSWESSIALLAILMQPATMLIDHGHFQYNTVMLGLVVGSVSSMLARRALWGSVFFVGALGFKQMALFYAPAIFAYLLGVCLFPRPDILRLIKIGLVTILSFTALFAPLLLGATYHSYVSAPTSITSLPAPPLLSSLPFNPKPDAWYYPLLLQLAQSVHRIFPFARGLFEDKVANLWCALHHSIHKLSPRYSSAVLQRMALLATSTLITPPCMTLFLRPSRRLLPWALAATAWAFFLASFQVHEKNVILPLLPMSLLLGGEGGLAPPVRAWVGLANILGAWTMFPLLRRDGLAVPYAVLTGLWGWLLGLPPWSWECYRKSESKEASASAASPGAEVGWVTTALHAGLYAAMLGWHVLEACVEPPQGKPDLWIVLNVLVGTAGFGLCYLWCLWGLLVRSGLFEGWKDTGNQKEKEKSL